MTHEQYLALAERCLECADYSNAGGLLHQAGRAIKELIESGQPQMRCAMSKQMRMRVEEEMRKGSQA